MQPIIAFNVISKQFTKHRNSIQKLEFDINAGAAATVYIQVFDFPSPADLANQLTVPANGSAPIKSWPVPAGATQNYKEFKNGELPFANGVFVCVSTTQATLTLGTGNNKFDSVATELWDLDISGTTEVSGKNLTNLAVWSEANGATHSYRLLRASIVNNGAAIVYLMLFGYNSATAADGTYCIAQWQIAATGDANGGDIVLVDFGVKAQNSICGREVKQLDSAHVVRPGCGFVVSSTPNVLTKVVATDANLYAEYK